MDLLSLPGARVVLGLALSGALQRSLLYPRHLLLHLAPGGGLPAPPPALLQLRLISADGLSASKARGAVYVTAELRARGVQRSPARPGGEAASWAQSEPAHNGRRRLLHLLGRGAARPHVHAGGAAAAGRGAHAAAAAVGAGGLVRDRARVPQRPSRLLALQAGG